LSNYHKVSADTLHAGYKGPFYKQVLNFKHRRATLVITLIIIFVMNKIFYLFFGAIVCLTLGMGNTGGRAASGGDANTGAPDEPGTCENCHATQSVNSTATLQVLDGNTAVTQYVPGKEYIVRVTGASNTASIRGYGFQMIVLRNMGNGNIRGFSDPGGNANNYKLTTLANRREYAEHDGVPESGVFNVNWKAPAAGTGMVSFYAATNAANRNGGTSGDRGANTSLSLTEAATSSAKDIATASAAVRVWPNPVAAQLNLQLNVPESGQYLLSIRDLSGKLVRRETRQLPSGEQQLTLPADDWTPGTYLIEMTKGTYMISKKVVKL
jgi:Secretion system C-terminal sorting domain